MGTNKVLQYNLRPWDAESLDSISKGNKSYIVRKWVEEYLENPVEFERQDDNLVKTTLSLNPDLMTRIKTAANDANLPAMQLLRLIIEYNLHK